MVVRRMMQQLAHTVIRRRRIVFAVWIVLSIVGAGFAGGIGDRLSQQFSIPGYSAYEANQRIFKDTKTGKNFPLVTVFHTAGGDITKKPGLEQRVAAAAKENPGSRVSSYFNTGGNAAYVSKDRQTMFAVIYPAGRADFNGLKTLPKTRTALKQDLPAGVTANLTGQEALYDASGADSGSSLGLEIAIGGVGALVVLLFIFGTLPAVAMPLMVAAASILNTYTLITLLTEVMQVSVIVQFLVAIIGLGVAIDYSLLMIFRYREELASGEDRETAVVETMKHAGRAVVVSGSTVAIGLLSLIVLPLPFIRSIGIADLRHRLVPALCGRTAERAQHRRGDPPEEDAEPGGAVTAAQQQAEHHEGGDQPGDAQQAGQQPARARLPGEGQQDEGQDRESEFGEVVPEAGDQQRHRCPGPREAPRRVHRVREAQGDRRAADQGVGHGRRGLRRHRGLSEGEPRHRRGHHELVARQIPQGRDHQDADLQRAHRPHGDPDRGDAGELREEPEEDGGDEDDRQSGREQPAPERLPMGFGRGGHLDGRHGSLLLVRRWVERQPAFAGVVHLGVEIRATDGVDALRGQGQRFSAALTVQPEDEGDAAPVEGVVPLALEPGGGQRHSFEAPQALLVAGDLGRSLGVARLLESYLDRPVPVAVGVQPEPGEAVVHVERQEVPAQWEGGPHARHPRGRGHRLRHQEDAVRCGAVPGLLARRQVARGRRRLRGGDVAAAAAEPEPDEEGQQRTGDGGPHRGDPRSVFAVITTPRKRPKSVATVRTQRRHVHRWIRIGGSR